MWVPKLFYTSHFQSGGRAPSGGQRYIARWHFLLKIHSYCFLFVSKCLNLTDFYFLCSMRIEELYKFDYLSIKLQFEAVAVNVSM